MKLMPGDVVRCRPESFPALLGLLGLTAGKSYMVLDSGGRDHNLGEASVLVRDDRGREFWALASRFRREVSDA